MNVPGLDDKYVEVSAYLTDETFGYDHWRAAQLSAPHFSRFGVLVLFVTETERDAWLAGARSASVGPFRGHRECRVRHAK